MRPALTGLDRNGPLSVFEQRAYCHHLMPLAHAVRSPEVTGARQLWRNGVRRRISTQDVAGRPQRAVVDCSSNRPTIPGRSLYVLMFILVAPLSVSGCGAHPPSAWEPAGSMRVGGEVLDLARRDDQIRVCRADSADACVAGAIAVDTLEMSGFGDGLVLGILGADYPTVEAFSGRWEEQSVVGDDLEAVTVFVGHADAEDLATFRLASQRWGTSEGPVSLTDAPP